MASTPTNPAPAPADTALIDALAQVSFTVIALLSRAAAEHDLSLTQLRALAILRDHEPTMAGLADTLGLERSSVSGLIDRAVRRGLVRREASATDGRAVKVTFTPEGERLAATITAEIADLIAPLTARLGAADQRRLGQLLGTLLGSG
jgi:DNA-binding MarR family transcriptional regulator